MGLSGPLERLLPRICDYEGSRYRTDFWEGRGREYENRVERIALQKLLPPKGERLIEVGAGFGRLADLYTGYRQVVLMDYARSQLEEAQRHLGRQERFIYVVADIYHMPFSDSIFDALTMVRVMHHLADVPAALAQIYRVLKPDGTAVVEHASKFHLKALARWFTGRQEWNPFDLNPLEFVELNFDFHPAWMRQKFRAAGLRIRNIRTVSHYRLGALKRTLPTDWLVAMDSWVQATGNWWQLTPSIFLQAQAQKPDTPPATGFFLCPACGHSEFSRQKHPVPSAEDDRLLVCQGCQRGWSFLGGIYDFKTPISA